MINLSKATLLLIATLALTIGSCKKDTRDNLLTDGDPAKVESASINSAREDKTCGAIQIKDAAMQARKDAMEQQVQAYLAQRSSLRTGSQDAPNSMVTVPVVFHV